MNRQQQGDLGEASARAWYEQRGACVFVPLGRSPDYDFIADDGSGPVTVQVKSSGQRSRHGNWIVSVCTRGGNQSWNKIVKHFSPARCDVLFVVTVDGRRWRIASRHIQATTAICVGGSKYAEFEVEAGPPLDAALARGFATLTRPGGLAKRSNAQRCKRCLSEFPGSNPGPATCRREPRPRAGFSRSGTIPAWASTVNASPAWPTAGPASTPLAAPSPSTPPSPRRPTT